MLHLGFKCMQNQRFDGISVLCLSQGLLGSIVQETCTVRTQDAATRNYPGECFLLGISLLTMSRERDTTEALLGQDLLHSPGPAPGRSYASCNHMGGWLLLGIFG